METLYFPKGNGGQNRERVIFVEGKDDAQFLSAMLTEIQADPQRVGIVEVEGKPNFHSRLKVFLKSSYVTQGVVKTISIICDADADPKKAEEEVNKIITSLGHPAVQIGTYVTTATGIRIGLFTMPNPTMAGDLEKLCLDTVEGHDLERKAEEFIVSAEALARQDGKELTGSRHKRKAQVFLSGFAGDLIRGAGRGYAIGCFKTDHDALEPLRNFLRLTIA